MKLANVEHRPVLVVDGGVIDVPHHSPGQYPDFEAIFADWQGFRAWAHTVRATPVEPAGPYGPAIPRPRQVFGVGFNYTEHTKEAAAVMSEKQTAESLPLIFTKFPSSITGPTGAVELPDGTTDYEIELVVAIGKTADRVSVDQGWAHVAGLLIGQDISSRGVQFLAPEQHSVGKSFRTFAPLGPYLVTTDEFDDPTDLEMRCWVNGELRQSSSTAGMTVGVAELVALLSAVTTLQPGDLIFTGTPSGVGAHRNPPVYLSPGDVISSEISGLGRMENHCRAACPAPDFGRRWHM